MIEERPLGSLLGCLIDYRGKTPPKTAVGVKLITAKVIKDGSIEEGRPEFISEETYGTWMRRGFPKRGDILVTTEAPLGEVAQLRTDERVALAQRVILLRPDPSKVDAQYLFHFLRSPVARQRLRERASGTTVSGIRQPELRAVSISLPDRATQSRIGLILDALDDLIENNRRRIALLERMAQAIYREWFVHFRYPGHDDDDLVDSPLGPIPVGWEVQRLIDLASIVMGQSPRSEHYNKSGDGLPFHQGVSNFGPNYPHRRLYCRVDGRIAEAGDYLVSVRAPVGRINRSDERLVIGRGLAAVRSQRRLQSLLGQQLRGVFHEEDVMGGGTIFKAITKGDLEGLQIVEPAADISQVAETVLEPIDGLIRALTFAARELENLRDRLLPKLVTGAIDVSRLDLDALLEEPAA